VTRINAVNGEINWSWGHPTNVSADRAFLEYSYNPFGESLIMS